MITKPVFIHLLHGRDNPEEDMTDWGFAGPILGPFEAVHFTYKEHIRCITDAGRGTEFELGFHDDLLVHEGKFYGDFEICGGHNAEDLLAAAEAVLLAWEKGDNLAGPRLFAVLADIIPNLAAAVAEAKGGAA